ncbi:MAG: hypothetical protein ABI227_14715 [Rhodanobacter sp.]
MMLSNNLASAPPKPTTTSAPTPINAAPTDADDKRTEHTDYNLHPLAVHSLEHYVIHDDEDERFRVS